MIASHIYSSSQFYRQDYLDCDGDIQTIRQLTDFRVHLLHNGYEPIPVKGKHVLNTGWSSGEMTEERVRSESEGSTAKLNTGFRCGRAVGVDNDLKSPEHAAAVQEVVEYFLGHTRPAVLPRLPRAGGQHPAEMTREFGVRACGKKIVFSPG